MSQHPSQLPLPRAQVFTERAFATFDRFLRIEALSGIVLVIAAAVALIWANSSVADSYHDLWHMTVSLGIGSLEMSRPLHFWINDAMMTTFFLVVGMEIRREIHEGALNNIRHAALPIFAALGGVVVPAAIYLSLNLDVDRQAGWAIPTATDIAFAMGILALLGRSIPGNIRVFLLTLAIIDDIIAVLIIAFFYSGGLEYGGFLIAGLGILIILAFQQMGIGSAFAYILPGAIVWAGILMTGAHPTLAGVVLGLMTPVVAVRLRERPVDMLMRVTNDLLGRDPGHSHNEHQLSLPLREIRLAQRELLPPVVRVQMALHPWVAFGVMPLFALANAGISLDGVDPSAGGAQWTLYGVALALVFGKPLGVILTSWLAVRLGWCQLPEGVSWGGVLLVGLLAGVGFTMSIFISMLAFTDETLLAAAKLGVLTGSLIAALTGLTWGMIYVRRQRAVLQEAEYSSLPSNR